MSDYGSLILSLVTGLPPQEMPNIIARDGSSKSRDA